ncbi:MAG: hypothetical protein EXS55_00130 [Candidatus Magasanikbacteria bacterium]|nr:hypothetical protein [Candidatus Magasanikbacteria bacterium]
MADVKRGSDGQYVLDGDKWVWADEKSAADKVSEETLDDTIWELQKVLRDLGVGSNKRNEIIAKIEFLKKKPDLLAALKAIVTPETAANIKAKGKLDEATLLLVKQNV